jgi:hypothetical protein
LNKIAPFVINEAQHARSHESRKRAVAEDTILETRMLKTASTGTTFCCAVRLYRASQ